MRSITTFFLLASALAAFALWRSETADDKISILSAAGESTKTVESIQVLERYEDQDYGFSVAVPAGWTRVYAAQPDGTEVGNWPDELEPGYAVGFESPRSGSRDRFADYILIELLPGDEFGLFDATGAQQNYFQSEQTKFVYDRLSINSALDDSIDVDLVIFQRGVQAFGYTLAFYAIGEPANEKILFEAFQIMLRTFEQIKDPFVVI